MSEHVCGDMPRHSAFILRLWETRSVPPDPDTRWRLSLEDVHTGEKHAFRDVEKLSAFLTECMGRQDGPVERGPDVNGASAERPEPGGTQVDGQREVETKAPSVLLVLEDEAVRDHVRAWVEAIHPDCAIYEAEGVEAALAAVRTAAPHIVLVHSPSPDENVLESVRRLGSAAPGARIVALAGEGEFGEESLRVAGADCCLPMRGLRKDPEPVAPARSGTKAEMLEGRTVVCIEDEPDMISLIKLALERHQVKLIGALGGREGLEKVRQVKPDLVLLDLMMPDVNGAEVLETLKADETLKDIPVVVLTVLDLRYSARQGVDPARVQGYIRKPFVPRRLVETVDAALQVVA